MVIRNICVYGAGALGGAFAAKIAAGLGSAANVSVIARGAHLAAIREQGLHVAYSDNSLPSLSEKVFATDDPLDLPAQDLVITGLKGHQLAGAAEGLGHLLKQGTRIVMILNGVPWWYFHRDSESGLAERQLPELDPQGKLWALVGPDRVIGCVAYQGAEVVAPGRISLSNNGRFFLGEPSGEITADLDAVTALLRQAELEILPTNRIRDEIWTKLRGNAAFNPISALTRALMVDVMADPSLARMVGQIMNEAQSVGQSLGCRFAVTADEHLAKTQSYPAARTSMLQDLLAGKPLEIVPLTGMVVSLGRLTGVPTPVCDTVLALTTQLDRENLRN
ncbi:2-dehydropantoate 2-reductase [Rhizobium deserti]|uniref:2-dehydropantoate 2-reductase n=1 Tax=Rhizobium deserti TaxID=2547961 RepID=A0A4R5UJ32_9HYPH|nr:2-dehydropantoate 2-reductase [Rhizobium deserti]TDK36857.1 2-dehydropantoate 2-reductase [Rhizobium deserti]